MMHFPSRAKDATVKESVQLWQDRVYLDLVLHQKGAKTAITVSHRGSRWGVVWTLTDMPGTSQWVTSSYWVPFPATLALVLLLYGVKVLILGGTYNIFRGMEPSQPWPSRLLLRHLGTCPSLQWGSIGRWVQENFQLTPGSGFSPSVSSSGSHHGNGCHPTLGKDLAHAPFRSGSPTKTLGIQRL